MRFCVPAPEALKEERILSFLPSCFHFCSWNWIWSLTQAANEGKGREKPGKMEVAKLTGAEFKGVKCWAWDCSTSDHWEALFLSILWDGAPGATALLSSCTLLSIHPANSSWVGSLSEIAQEGQLHFTLVFIKLFALLYKIHWFSSLSPHPHPRPSEQTFPWEDGVGELHLLQRDKHPCKRQKWTKISISKYQDSWNTNKQKSFWIKF